MGFRLGERLAGKKQGCNGRQPASSVLHAKPRTPGTSLHLGGIRARIWHHSNGRTSRGTWQKEAQNGPFSPKGDFWEQKQRKQMCKMIFALLLCRCCLALRRYAQVTGFLEVAPGLSTNPINQEAINLTPPLLLRVPQRCSDNDVQP